MEALTPRHTRVLLATDPVRHLAALKEAANVLQQGGLVVLPTETVYGIGANALDREAVADIFAAKGRPQDNPLIVHIADFSDLDGLVAEIPDSVRKLAGAFWPGPLTMIMPRGRYIPDSVSAGLDTVAIRMPSHPVARALIRLAGVPVAAPSANLSGSPSPTTAAHCYADLSGRVDIILDGGRCSVGLESTVLSLAGERPRLLRPGAVTPEQLRELLEDLVIDDAVLHSIDAAQPVASPGMKYKHYAPRADITLVHGGLEAYLAFLEEHKGSGVFALTFDADKQRSPVPCVTYGSEHDPASQAEGLFSALRRLDASGARQVYARAPLPQGLGLAVYNRLVRAAAFREVYLGDQVPQQFLNEKWGFG